MTAVRTYNITIVIKLWGAVAFYLNPHSSIIRHGIINWQEKSLTLFYINEFFENKVQVTKISNYLVHHAQHCIYANLVKIHQLV